MDTNSAPKAPNAFSTMSKPGVLAILVAVVVGGYLLPMFRADAEISQEQYFYLTSRVEGSCPMLGDRVSAALKNDDRITNTEYQDITLASATCERHAAVAQLKSKLVASK